MRKMKRLFLLTAVVAVSLSTVAMKHMEGDAGSRPSDLARIEVTNAPFRDGLYLGQLSAKQGRSFHVPSGRWASSSDRVSFTAGFERGYQQGLQRLAASKPY
jgi:hypothetical protein